MEWILLIAGAVLAAGLSEAGVVAPVLGAVTGWLLGMILRQRNALRQLQIKLASLERQFQQQQASHSRKREASAAAEPEPSTAAPRNVRTPYETTPPVSGSSTTPAGPQDASREGARADADFPESSKIGSATREASSATKPAATATPSHPDIFQLGLRWLLSGNVPAKVGVIISFFGVSFLLKYAVDAGLVSFSPVARVIAVLVFASVLLWFGWRLRERKRSYAMALSGGGIGMFYLAFYAAFRLYDLLPATLAFFLMAMVAAFSVWLAIRERAFPLAGLGVTGGFLAPLLASTGSGSHVALFSYYLLINIAIAAVAFFQHWRLLNLIGFIFTFMIGLAWGAQYYDAQYFHSVEPFLIAHFLLYVVVAVLSALRQPFRLKGYVDSALVFGLPLIVFPLQSGLVEDFERGMAWSSIGLGIFYCALWLVLRRSFGQELKLLLQAFLALGIAFLTLAIPLWLDAPWVSGSWALEGAGMIWIGLQQRREISRWFGLGLLFLALPALLVQIDSFDTSCALLNSRFIGLASIALSAFLAARFHEVAAAREAPALKEFRSVAELLAWGGLLLWLAGIAAEISEHLPGSRSPFWSVLSVSVTATAFALLARGLHSTVFRRLGLGLALLLPLLALFAIDRLAHPLAEHGWLAWPAAFGLLALLRWSTPEGREKDVPFIDTVTLWTALLLVPMELYWLAGEFLPQRLWNEELALAGAAGMLLLAARLDNARAVFYQRHGLQAAVALLLFVMLATGIGLAGGQAPLPYLPVVNGLALASGMVLYATWRMLQTWFEQSRQLLAAFAAVSLLAITQEIARVTHQLADVRYDAGAMAGSDIFQAAVSVTWSILGLAAMGFGARRAQRHIWFAGAVLMGCVVLKLFAVDLGNTGTVARIVSFVGVGLLLLIVGYLAPAPGRTGRKEA